MAGSIDNAVGNSVYTDLVLTRYPKNFDERSGNKNNINLNRQTNLKDFNMAEHINALQDAVMSLQRVLGEMPQMPAEPKDAQGNPITDPTELANLAKIHTIKERIDAIELFDWTGLFDKRYGGPNWAYDKNKSTNPTIQQHRHTGEGNGMPSKIVLTDEVSGLLPKRNVNLGKTSDGITGSDIYVEPTSSVKIADAISDKVSETTGGVIEENATLTMLGKTNTRWTREFDANDASKTGNTFVSDNKTLIGKAAQSHGNNLSDLLNKQLTGMYYGKYVAIVRLATTSLASDNVAEISAIDVETNKVIKTTVLKGSDFDATNKYKTFYLVFEQNGETRLRIRKLATTSSIKVSFDYAIVEPVHPAVFDR